MSEPKDLRGADLSGRNFIQAKMFGANLAGADLSRETMPDGLLHN
jgi:uncharacterized protein YjbI with pentapeptide repeats